MRTKVKPELDLLTYNDLALALKTSKRTLYRKVRNGDLTAVRIGTSVRFRPEDVSFFLAEQRAKAIKKSLSK